MDHGHLKSKGSKGGRKGWFIYINHNIRPKIFNHLECHANEGVLEQDGGAPLTGWTLALWVRGRGRTERVHVESCAFLFLLTLCFCYLDGGEKNGCNCYGCFEEEQE